MMMSEVFALLHGLLLHIVVVCSGEGGGRQEVR